jgi:hypothetical protein
MDLPVFEGFGMEKKGVLGGDWWRWRPGSVSRERLVRVLENWFGFGRDRKKRGRQIRGREAKWWSVGVRQKREADGSVGRGEDCGKRFG